LPHWGFRRKLKVYRLRRICWKEMAARAPW
jgi:hypothetical protein